MRMRPGFHTDLQVIFGMLKCRQDAEKLREYVEQHREYFESVDLETYHPLEARGKKSDATPKDREFLAGVTLTLWLLDDVDLWERAVRRPVWPLRLGRSQDLASARSRRIDLRPGPGKQGSAILPVEVSTSGRQLRMPHTISLDRAHVQWGTYRYASSGSSATVDSPWHTSEGQAVVPLGSLHPQAAEQE